MKRRKGGATDRWKLWLFISDITARHSEAWRSLLSRCSLIASIKKVFSFLFTAVICFFLRIYFFSKQTKKKVMCVCSFFFFWPYLWRKSIFQNATFTSVVVFLFFPYTYYLFLDSRVKIMLKKCVLVILTVAAVQECGVDGDVLQAADARSTSIAYRLLVSKLQGPAGTIR